MVNSLYLRAYDFKRLLNEFAHVVHFSRRKDEILGIILLKHTPHALYVVAGCK